MLRTYEALKQFSYFSRWHVFYFAIKYYVKKNKSIYFISLLGDYGIGEYGDKLDDNLFAMDK